MAISCCACLNRQVAGDLVKRKTFREASSNDQPASGLELGMTATCAATKPWHVRTAELIDYIEMGTEVDWFANMIHKLLKLEVASRRYKAQTSEQAFQTGKHALGFSGEWNAYPGFALLNQSLDRSRPAWASRRGNRRASHDPGRCRESGIPTKSGAGHPDPEVYNRQPVVSIAILRDVSSSQQTNKQQLVMLILGATLLAILLFLALSSACSASKTA